MARAAGDQTCHAQNPFAVCQSGVYVL
jgi:hypothetical protein